MRNAWGSRIGINNGGQISGQFRASSLGRYQGFSRNTNGVVTTVEVPGSYATTFAFEINNAGQIVGWFNDGTGIHGFLATPVNAKGDCRVYQVSFEAEDLKGGACTGKDTDRRSRR